MTMEAKTYLFGSFYPRRTPGRATAGLGVNLPRLAVVVVAALLAVYVFAAGAGYLWLHVVRKVDQVTLWDVAQFRWKQVRREIAVQQYDQAKRAWTSGDYRAAYLLYASALRNGPDNVAGRLAAADFFVAVGSTRQAIVLLEDGLARMPDEPRLITRTFDLLTAIGRDRRVLELARQQPAAKLSAPSRALLQTYEVQATLATDGLVAARQLLDRYADLRKNPASAPVVARVRWESRDRLAAIETLAGYVEAHPDSLDAAALLADWQAAGGLTGDARATAKRACARFPRDPAARLMLIDALGSAGVPAAREWEQAVASYLADFATQPEAIVRLGNLAGRRGWVSLARGLYETGADRYESLALLALFYSDALAHASRWSEARAMLADLETQISESNAGLLALLRQRQVAAAAAQGDHEAAREYARRLAAALGDDPDELSLRRRQFAQLGITEAVEELTPRGVAAARADRR